MASFQSNVKGVPHSVKPFISLYSPESDRKITREYWKRQRKIPEFLLNVYEPRAFHEM